MKIEITEEESLVLFEFFERFDDTEELYFVHPAEYIALQKIAGQVCTGSPAMFQENYREQLEEARENIAKGYEGDRKGSGLAKQHI